MPSIISWMRLEPHRRNVEMNTSLQARIYDPLWLLARQWQLGEFQGEDNGSLVIARWRAEAAQLTRCHTGSIACNNIVEATRYDVSNMPLETFVERETIRHAAVQKPEKPRLARFRGQHFLRMLELQPLSQNYREVSVNQFPFPPLTAEQQADLAPNSLRFLRLLDRTFRMAAISTWHCVRS